MGTCIPKCQELRLLFSSGEWIGVKEQNSFSCFCAKPYPVIGFLRRKSNRSIVLSPSIFSYFFQQHHLFPIIQIKDLRISFSGFYLQFESHNCALIRQSVPETICARYPLSGCLIAFTEKLYFAVSGYIDVTSLYALQKLCRCHLFHITP